MRYGYTIERIGYDRGFAEGLAQGRLEVKIEFAISQLSLKLGTISPESINQIKTFSIRRINALSRASLKFESIADLEKWLAKRI
jgi:hypothetical protein